METETITTGADVVAPGTDYSAVLADINAELIKLNGHVDGFKEFIAIENEYLFMGVGLLVGSIVGLAVMKGLFNNVR